MTTTRRTLIAATALLMLAGCADDPQPGDPNADLAMGHVHGLGVDPADDTLYVATHLGLFRVTDGRAARVADRWQDTMAFVVVGDGHFLGSGHPDLREELPPRLGLIESTDAGETWRPLSLQGEADFHALEPVGDTIYGYDAASGALMVSLDRRTFQTVAEVPAVDLAVDPGDPGQVLVTTPEAELLAVDPRTGETGAIASPPLWFVDSSEPGVLVGVGPEGTVHISQDGAASWEAAGEVAGDAVALEVSADSWYAATSAGLFVSADEGQTWQVVEVGTDDR